MSNGRWIADELIQRAWAELSEEEREVFSEWLAHANGQDLYMLLRFVRRRRMSSSVQRMKAVKGDSWDE